jgi:hypothetical protein
MLPVGFEDKVTMIIGFAVIPMYFGHAGKK